MMGWLRQHRQALASAAVRFRRSGGLVGALVIGVALSLPAGGYALLESLRGLGAHATPEPQISIFLRKDAKRADAEVLGAALRSDARIAHVRFVPREEALNEMKAVQGMPEVLAALGHNPLPDAFVVIAKEGQLDALTADLSKLPSVAHVQADAVWARRLAALAGVARFALWLVAALLALALVAVTFNTVRLQVLTQRAEIEVSRLLGATDAFIRRPFYYLGLLQGLAGGGVSVCIVNAGLVLLNRQVRVLADSYGSAFRFDVLPLPDAVAVMLFAGLIGWAGAWLSVSRQLREMDASQ